MPVWLDTLIKVASSSLPEDVLEELWARGMSTEQAETFRVGYLPTRPAGDYPEEFVSWYHDREDALLFPLTTFRVKCEVFRLGIEIEQRRDTPTTLTLSQSLAFLA